MKPGILVFLICLLCAVHGRAEEASKRSEMIAEMQAAVNAIALKYGNPSFTQIFTNEPTRAAAVRKRFSEFERMDSLQKKINDLEAKAAKMNDELQAKEAIAADLDRRATARQLEIQSAASEAAARASTTQSSEESKM